MNQLQNKLASLVNMKLLKASRKDNVIRYKPSEGHTFYAHNVHATIAMAALDLYKDGRVVTWFITDGSPSSMQLTVNDFGIQHGDTLNDIKVV